MRLALLISVWTLTSGFAAAVPEQAVYPEPANAPSCDNLQLDEKINCFNSARASSPFSPAAKFAGAGITLTLSDQRQLANPRLQDGDRLIKINREPVTNVNDLARLVEAASDRPLKPVDVLLAREGELVFLTISLDEMIDVVRAFDQTGLSDLISLPGHRQSLSSALVGNKN